MRTLYRWLQLELALLCPALDSQLDDLHAKIRSMRQVTTDASSSFRTALDIADFVCRSMTTRGGRIHYLAQQ